MNKDRQRRSTLVLVFMAGAILFLLILAIAFAGGGEPTAPMPVDRSVPQSVNERVVTSLAKNDLMGIYSELSPEMKNFISEESFSAAQSPISGEVRVEILSPLTIRAEEPWNGQWAETVLRITRQGNVEEYLVRYHLENGEWWFYATLKVR
jgi:hypothetical protein